MELDFTPSCVKGDICKEARSSLTKSNSPEKEEGSFIDGGNPKEWDPWREISHVFKRRARQLVFLMNMIIDFMSA